MSSVRANGTAALTAPRPSSEKRGYDHLVLILALTGDDATLTEGFLKQRGLQTKICSSMAETVERVKAGCGTLLVAEEAIEPAGAELLNAALALQPSWSDFPIVVATTGGSGRPRDQGRLAAPSENANVTLLERPFRPATLIRMVEVALRTRRRQYEVRDLLAKLEASSGRIRRILEQTVVGIAETDLTGRFTLVNDQYCKIVRRSRADLLTMQMRDLVHAEDMETSVERFKALAEGRSSGYVIEKRYIDPDGAAIWVQDHVSAIRDLHGTICGVTIASADITERKAAEAEALHARDEAISASRAKDDFLAALSHELRTPLNPVLLLASDGKGNPDYPPDVRAVFETITRNVSLEARLIDDLLDLTRITQKKLTLDRQPHDVHAILCDALATIKADTHERRVRVSVEFVAATPTVLGDAVRLQQVFWNVLKNAVKFTPPGGSIAVTTRIESAPPRVVVSVRDTGFGMNEAELARIFQPFTQGDHARKGSNEGYGGLGLGLAISKTFVELHAGTISARSAGRGCGSTFVIELPLLVAPTATPSLADGSASVNPSTDPGAPRRILLVEDHVSTRAALATLLSRRHLHVLPAGSVREALDIAAREPVDLLISDIGLPDGTGYELMHELHLKYGLRGIALTGYGMDQDVAESRAAGFVAHVTKPVDVASLEKVLRQVGESFALGAALPDDHS